MSIFIRAERQAAADQQPGEHDHDGDRMAKRENERIHHSPGEKNPGREPNTNNSSNLHRFFKMYFGMAAAPVKANGREKMDNMGLNGCTSGFWQI